MPNQDEGSFPKPFTTVINIQRKKGNEETSFI